MNKSNTQLVGRKPNSGENKKGLRLGALNMVGRERLERSTNWLKANCSTN